MNPELMRNLWLESSPRRLAIMAGVLGFLFVTIWISSTTDKLSDIARAAELLFYAIVVVWGTRSAASTVVDEIRDRTWDLQRLSAIAPWDMLWGKLLGSTSYVWFGGLLCLIPITLDALATRGIGAALLQSAFFVSIGLIAHSSSLLASLVSVRRRINNSRMNTFGFQLFGIIMAGYAWSIWSSATPGALGISPWLGGEISAVTWYGQSYSAPVFYLTSLAIFSGWILAGCHQFMRQELQVSMNPLVWLGFLIFLAGYCAGFAEPGLPFTDSIKELPIKATDAVRWLVATAVLLSATYVSLLLMPKERVKMRWLLSQAASGRIFDVLAGLPGWAFGFALTAIAASISIAQVGTIIGDQSGDATIVRLFTIGILGELARNIGIFMFFNMLQGQRRGDFAALLTLILLYTVAPLFLTALGIPQVGGLISPWAELPSVSISSVAMWVEAAIIWPFAMLRLTQARP